MAFEFWFEYGSTYTYLTVMRIDRLAADSGVEVQWKPFLLMPIVIGMGMEEGPFLPYPVKLRYMWRDVERRARSRGLPYRKPSVYPPNTLLAARIGLLAEREGWCADFTRNVFHRHSVEDKTIGSEENLNWSLGALGKEPEEILAQAQTDDDKAALRQQTENANNLGIFGSPSFVVGDELFWGDDRLEDAFAFASNPW